MATGHSAEVNGRAVGTESTSHGQTGGGAGLGPCGQALASSARQRQTSRPGPGEGYAGSWIQGTGKASAQQTLRNYRGNTEGVSDGHDILNTLLTKAHDRIEH